MNPVLKSEIRLSYFSSICIEKMLNILIICLVFILWWHDLQSYKYKTGIFVDWIIVKKIWFSLVAYAAFGFGF